MRDRLIQTTAGARLAAGVDTDRRSWLGLTSAAGATVSAELSEGELLMAVEALAMVYADVVGADAASVARGVNRSRTSAARERRRQAREAA